MRSVLAAILFFGALGLPVPASSLMLDHIGNVEDALGQSAAESATASERLRATLAPLRVVR